MAIITYREIVRSLRELGFNQDSNVIAHVSLEALEPGSVRGEAETVLSALLAACGTVVMPAFTPQTLVWPESGPPDNGCTYGNHAEENARAVMFSADLAVDADLGQVAERFRRLPQARRSDHPAWSFAAVGAHAQEVVAAQSLECPLGPVEWLYDRGGDVLLMGTDHRHNTAIHLAEKFAGRKQFVRWAVGVERAYRLPDFPGCSNGFNAISGKLAWITHQVTMGGLAVQRIPIIQLVEVAMRIVQEDPYALLCNDHECERCNAVRQAAG
jgi:aminoglycoside 3-N-acetyltransferase